MALVKCKECGGVVSTDAKSCPTCGVAAPKKTSFVTWGVLVIIVFAVWAHFQSGEKPASPQEIVKTSTDDHTEAKKICQDFVYKQLKAPSTSKFESLNSVAAQPSKDKKWEKMNGVWDSVGWVDSQNSFGAMIRSEYMCTIQKLPDNTWKLLDLSGIK